MILLIIGNIIVRTYGYLYDVVLEFNQFFFYFRFII